MIPFGVSFLIKTTAFPIRMYQKGGHPDWEDVPIGRSRHGSPPSSPARHHGWPDRPDVATAPLGRAPSKSSSPRERISLSSWAPAKCRHPSVTGRRIPREKFRSRVSSSASCPAGTPFPSFLNSLIYTSLNSHSASLSRHRAIQNIHATQYSAQRSRYYYIHLYRIDTRLAFVSTGSW